MAYSKPRSRFENQICGPLRQFIEDPISPLDDKLSVLPILKQRFLDVFIYNSRRMPNVDMDSFDPLRSSYPPSTAAQEWTRFDRYLFQFVNLRSNDFTACHILKLGIAFSNSVTEFIILFHRQRDRTSDVELGRRHFLFFRNFC